MVGEPVSPQRARELGLSLPFLCKARDRVSGCLTHLQNGGRDSCWSSSARRVSVARAGSGQFSQWSGSLGPVWVSTHVTIVLAPTCRL